MLNIMFGVTESVCGLFISFLRRLMTKALSTDPNAVLSTDPNAITSMPTSE